MKRLGSLHSYSYMFLEPESCCFQHFHTTLSSKFIPTKILHFLFRRTKSWKSTGSCWKKKETAPPGFKANLRARWNSCSTSWRTKSNRFPIKTVSCTSCNTLFPVYSRDKMRSSTKRAKSAVFSEEVLFVWKKFEIQKIVRKKRRRLDSCSSCWAN